MRTLAGILLAAALLLSIAGFIECFPGVQERDWQHEVQRLSAGGQPSEIRFHFQSQIRQARDSRIEAATECFLPAALLFYLGWVAITRPQTRLLHLQCIGSILLSLALLLGFYGIVNCFPSSYEHALKQEFQRSPKDWRADNIALNLRYTRQMRLQAATASAVIAALLGSLGWIAITRPKARPIQPDSQRPIILPAKPHLAHLQRFSTPLLGRMDRIKGARVKVRRKLEVLIEHPSIKDESETVG